MEHFVVNKTLYFVQKKNDYLHCRIKISNLLDRELTKEEDTCITKTIVHESHEHDFN